MINCQFENGNKASLRHVTLNAIVTKDGKILLGKRGYFKGKPISEFGKWAFPGGFFDRDETLIEAIKREVREESGWEIENLILFKICDDPARAKEDRQNVDFLFIAQAVEQKPVDSEEVTELKWFDLENLPPKDQIAFDFAQDLEFYKKYLKQKFPIPVLG